MPVKFNMNPKKNPMPSQDPNVRNKNFLEVTLGYTEEMAVDEAKRCLNCKNKPCVSGCPVNIHIPEFIQKVAEERLRRCLPDHQPVFFSAGCVRPCMSAGNPVRRQVHPRHQRRTGGHRPSGTLCGGLAQLPTAPRPPKSPSPTATRWPSWVPALPV